MLARRLLGAGSGSGFGRGSFDGVGVAGIGNGGAWTEVTTPHAIHAGTRTYIGWVTGNSNPNDIQVSARPDGGGGLEGPITLFDHLTGGSSTEPDTHIGPAVTVRSDGYIVAAYCNHAGPTMHVQVSNSAYDITDGFGAGTTFGITTGTYPQLAIISTDRIYLRYRGFMTGTQTSLCQRYSDDGGVTWSAEKELVKSTSGSGSNEYSAMACNGSRIDHVLTNHEPAHVGGFGLWHFYLDDTGTYHKSDGTVIAVGDPTFALVLSDLTEIVADGGDAYPYSISYTGDGHPVIACQSKQADPVEIFEYRWSGSAWERHDIDTSDPISPSILSLGGGCHVWDDSERFYSAKMVDGLLQMFEYISADDGATWTGTQLTYGTDQPNSPVYVVDNGAELAAVWFIGVLGSDDDFEYGLQGIA